MRNTYLVRISFGILTALLATAQAPAPQVSPAKPAAAKPAPAKPAPAKPVEPSLIDEVIAAVKANVAESDILDDLKQRNAPLKLQLSDRTKLKNAGVSDVIIKALQDPSASAPALAVVTAPAPTATSAPSPAPSPVIAIADPGPGPAATGPATQSQKKRAIVDEFDYSAVMTAVQTIFGTQQNIGKGIRAMLTTRLSRDGKVVIVERTKGDILLKEQAMNQGNNVKQGSGARVGRISGADVLLAGDIVIFGRDDKKKGAAAGIVGGFCKFCGAVAMNKKEEKAVVAIDYRVIDVETSEVIATGEARGESSRKSSNFAAIAGALGGAGGAAVDMTSSNFAETIIGEATQDCVNKLAEVLATQTISMKKTVREVEARVALVNENVLTINVGGNDGVNNGETFEVFRVISEIKDPTTKEVLDLQTEKVGEMTITSVRDKIATGNYSGSPVQVNFVARKKLQP